MTLTEALAPYTIRGADAALRVTTERVEVEYDVVAGKSRWSRPVLEVGDDIFVKITRPYGVDRPLFLDVESGPDHPPGSGP